MIIINQKSKRSTVMELQVYILINDLKDVQDLYSFKSCYDREVKNIPRTNCYQAEYSYRLFANDRYDLLELWHCSAVGDKTRLIATIEDDGIKAPDVFDIMFL